MGLTVVLPQPCWCRSTQYTSKPLRRKIVFFLETDSAYKLSIQITFTCPKNQLIRDKNPSTLDIERNMPLESKSNAWRRNDKMGWSNHNERGQLNAVFTGICWRLHSI